MVHGLDLPEITVWLGPSVHLKLTPLLLHSGVSEQRSTSEPSWSLRLLAVQGTQPSPNHLEGPQTRLDCLPAHG